MNIDIFTDTPFGDGESFTSFLGAHEIAHQTIATKLIGNGHLINTVPMTSVPTENSDWLLDHYQIHREIAQAIGSSVPDLSQVDFDDEEQYVDWMQSHGQLHSQINTALRITT